MKPMKWIFPASRAATSASMLPPGAKQRSGSDGRITSWICMRSTWSVPSRESDSSIWRVALAASRPSIFDMRKTFSR